RASTRHHRVGAPGRNPPAPPAPHSGPGPATMRRGTARHERSNLSKKAAVCCLRPRRPRGSISGSPAHRWAEGRIERFTELAAEFARLKVDLIVAATTPAVIAAKHGKLHVVAPEFDAPFVVAALAACAAKLPAGVAITATRRRTRSAMSAGRRSNWPSSQWYSTVTFWLST